MSVIRYDEGHVEGSQPVDHRHVHGFYLLAYVERGGGDLRLDREVRPLRTGEVILVPTGHVIGVGTTNPPSWPGVGGGVARRFGAWHGTTPLKWRRGSRTGGTGGRVRR